jgi:phosphoglycolate phosphatase-like HAD superfamily hydrolase
MASAKNINFSKIKLIIFDLDGTIVPLHKRFYTVWRDTLTKFNLPDISFEEFKWRIERDILTETIDYSVRQQFMKSFLSAYSQYRSPDEKLIPGAREALLQLKKAGFLIALATGRISSIEDLADEMKHHNLLEVFEVITTQRSEDAEFDKLYLKNKQIDFILEKLKVSPTQTIIVGDYITDIRSGKMMGLKTIAVRSSKVSLEVLEKEEPDLILNSVTDLPKVIFG